MEQDQPLSSELGTLPMCIAVDKSGSTVGRTIRSEKEVVQQLCNFGRDEIRRPVTLIPWSDNADNPVMLDTPNNLVPSLANINAWGGTDPSSLYRSDACLQAIRDSRVWVLMTDGKIFDSLVETFANETTHHGLHNKAGIIIVFGDTSKGRPAACDISVGIALYTQAPDCVFLFHDVPTGVVRIIQAKGTFRKLVPQVGLERPKLVISQYTAWAELPRISYEQLFSVQVQTIRDLDADEIALKDGLIVNMSDIFAGKVDEATSEQIVRDRDNLRSIALASRAKGTGKNLASWLKAQQKPLPKKSASPEDIDHRASLAINVLLDAIRTNESPDRITSLRERGRAAQEANLKDFWAKKAGEDEMEEQIRSTNVKIRNHYKRLAQPLPPPPPQPPQPPAPPLLPPYAVTPPCDIGQLSIKPTAPNIYAADNWGYDSDRAASPIGNSPNGSPKMTPSPVIIFPKPNPQTAPEFSGFAVSTEKTTPRVKDTFDSPLYTNLPSIYGSTNNISNGCPASPISGPGTSTASASGIVPPLISTPNLSTVHISSPSASTASAYPSAPSEAPRTTYTSLPPALGFPQPTGARDAMSTAGSCEKRKAECDDDLTDDESESSRRRRRNRMAQKKFRERMQRKRRDSDKGSVSSLDTQEFGERVLLLPGFRRRKPAVEYTGQCMLCHGTTSALTLLLKTPPANRATANFPAEGRHATIAFPFAMGAFAEMDVVSFFVPCNECAFYLLRIGSCPVPGDVITGALCLVSLPENQSVWLEALDQALRGRFDISDLMAMCVAILDAKTVENEGREAPSTEKVLFRDCVGWTLRQLIQVLEVHTALSPSFASRGMPATATTTTTLGQLLLRKRFADVTHTANEDLLLLRYPAQGFAVLARLLSLLQLVRPERMPALFFQKLVFQVMEQFLAQQKSRTLPIADLLNVERKGNISTEELIAWGLLDEETLAALDGGGPGMGWGDVGHQGGPAMAVIVNQLLQHSCTGRSYSSAVACFNAFKDLPYTRPVLLDPLGVTEEQVAEVIVSMM